MGKRYDGRSASHTEFVDRYRGVAFSLLFVAVVLAGAVAGAPVLDVGETSTAATATLANGSDGSVTEIDSCTVIDEPGRYEVTADVRGSGAACVHVKADDVIVDGNGHTVRAMEGSNASVGLLVHNGSANEIEQDATEPSNVTIRDLRIANWNAGVRTGEFFSDGPTVTLENVTATDNGNGFVFYGAGESSLANLTATGNDGHGIFIWESTFVDARDLTVENNTGSGIDLAQSVLGSNFTGVTSTGNQLNGIDVGTSSVDNRFTDVYVANNGRAGVRFSDSTGTVLRNATIENNHGPGVLSDFGDADRVENVTAANNSIAYDGSNNFAHYGVVAEDFHLRSGVTASFGTNVTSLDDAEDVPAVPRNASVAGPGVNLTVKEGDDAEPRARLVFPYDDAAVGNESRLAVLRYDDGWNVVFETSIDTDDQRIEATVERGGIVVPVLAEDTGSVSGTESTFVVNSTGDGEAFYYGFVVDGEVETAGETEFPAEAGQERITERDDGTALVRGTTGDGYGDSFVVTGEIVTFGTHGEDPSFRIERDGEDVTDQLVDGEAE